MATEKEWNSYLESYGYRVTKSSINFWKIMGVIGMLFIIANSTFFGYMFFFTDSLKGFIKPIFNNTVSTKIDNQYGFNMSSDTNNKFYFEPRNNFTIFITNFVECP